MAQLRGCCQQRCAGRNGKRVRMLPPPRLPSLNTTTAPIGALFSLVTAEYSGDSAAHISCMPVRHTSALIFSDVPSIIQRRSCRPQSRCTRMGCCFVRGGPKLNRFRESRGGFGGELEVFFVPLSRGGKCTCCGRGKVRAE